MKNTCILLIFFAIAASCMSDDTLLVKKLDGGYTVNEMTYDDRSIMDNVMAAMLSFDNKESMLFKPPIIKEEIGKYEKYAWSFSKDLENGYLLNFDTEHRYFKGDFRITFIVDNENRLLHLTLRSDRTYINCTRLYVFESFDSLKDSW